MSEPVKCAACKRPMKQPSPSGLGPVCERRLNGTPARIRTSHSPAAEPGPGQDELPLADQLEIWSTP